MNTPAEDSNRSAPWWVRLLSSTSVVALTLCYTVICLLCAAGWLAGAAHAFEEISRPMREVSTTSRIVVAVTLLTALGGPALLLLWVRRRGWLTWRVHAAAWAVALSVLGWLAWDEPTVRHLVPVEEFSPAFPGAEKSYALLMRYSNHPSSDEGHAFKKLQLRTKFAGASPSNAAKWREFVEKNRAEIEADWVTIAPQRAWLDELAAFDRIGDLTEPSFTSGVPLFQVWRSLAQLTCARATLLALDGRQAEAVDVLVPLLDTGRKLQVYSRTLVRTMVALVAERMAIETAQIILDQGPLSAESRAKLVAVLGRDNSVAMARRFVLTEYVLATAQFHQMRPSELIAAQREQGAGHVLGGLLDAAASVFLNVNATINLYGDHAFELAQLAEARELGKIAVAQKAYFAAVGSRTSPKNFVGRLMVAMMPPPFEKTLASHWKVADAAEALRKRLAG